jgi:hypothetical protein
MNPNGTPFKNLETWGVVLTPYTNKKEKNV